MAMSDHGCNSGNEYAKKKTETTKKYLEKCTENISCSETKHDHFKQQHQLCYNTLGKLKTYKTCEALTVLMDNNELMKLFLNTKRLQTLPKKQ